MADEAQSEQPDDREPTPERRAELRAVYEANTAQGKAPYEGVRIHTRGELLWIMRERAWVGDFGEHGAGPANLRGASFTGANLKGVKLVAANLSNTSFVQTNLTGANLQQAWLNEALLTLANLDNISLVAANLSGANLQMASLRGAHLWDARLAGAVLSMADLAGADLFGARLDNSTMLRDVHIDSDTVLCDVVWNGASLVRIDWRKVPMTGDEARAREKVGRDGRPKDSAAQLVDYERAVRANRQLAVALRAQGLNEHADRFAYRAQCLQRVILRHRITQTERYTRKLAGVRKRGEALLAYVGSHILDLVAGYGFKPGNAIIAYLFVILTFASAYFAFGPSQGVPLSPLGALVFSVTSFHGRGFFPGGSPGHSITLDDPLTVLAAGEAVLGLVIEVSFIATFTQRFFAR
jgi:uncharacterized protein YjbI with pentapeptide repeats